MNLELAQLTRMGAPAASAIMGLAVATLIGWLGRMAIRRPAPSNDSFEDQRRGRLRSGSSLYRIFEPLIDELAGGVFADQQSGEFARLLKSGENELPFNAAEFSSAKCVEGILVGLAIFVFVAITGFFVFAATLGFLVALIYPVMARHSIVSQATRRLKRIRLRLPFVVDQIALMMEAGAGFEDSLRTVVEDSGDHPIRDELSEVLRQIDLGRRRDQALSEFRDRMEDTDISEFVFAIVKGEELGTPLSTILREQANQMRLKRSQWGEKAAAEAEVQIVFPGMISMVACLLVIIAPILLPAVMTFLEN